MRLVGRRFLLVSAMFSLILSLMAVADPPKAHATLCSGNVGISVGPNRWDIESGGFVSCERANFGGGATLRVYSDGTLLDVDKCEFNIGYGCNVFLTLNNPPGTQEWVATLSWWADGQSETERTSEKF